MTELEALNEVLPQLQEMNATVLAVSPQRQPFSRQVVRDAGLGFEILTDAGNKVAEKFGIAFPITGELKEVYQGFSLDLKRINGDDSWTLAMPARFVIGQDGVVHSADVDPDYTRRTEPEETVMAVKRLLSN
ncbi:redoxin domain-containing protein [Sansalvadorimonas verongulae]|uniref:redoxin domain-containing protein n=1 Tax=Sansalvadorimonas verongulae TaxID=2172824 RepID=UPI002E30F8ED|nr:redoxin domain-containing protein [Sansalvadorimonas verongulae]MTI15570.1 redoxin domain-containing protein [Sansalvadorimonas verongulae]